MITITTEPCGSWYQATCKAIGSTAHERTREAALLAILRQLVTKGVLKP